MAQRLDSHEMPNDMLLGAALLFLLLALGALVVAAGLRREVVALRHRLRNQSAVRAGNATIAVDVGELQQMADALGIGLVRIDGEGRIVLANEVGHRLLGRRPGALVGRSTMEGFLDHRIEELVRRSRPGATAQLELTSSGEPQVTLVARSRHVRRDGGAWVVLEDVSELRRLQRIRAEFIDNLSHELRTPLTTVRLLTESLVLYAERSPLPERVRESVEQIDVETGHLVQMVNELLDLAKIEQGEVALAVEDVDLGQVVERSLERLRLYAERQQVKLQGQMPASTAERMIRGDEQRIGQLLINLLHNAVKFSPAGGEVTVRLRASDNEIVMEVEDRGIGIPSRELERIFERFYKVDRARSRDGGGTGLGLAIARHIAERHGGRMWAESEEGRGSRFFVALPRAEIVPT
jgi:two-component system, OmpR family, phosphate regulon sensor histidine kinase PhoR